jgi:hypothetical protein
MPRASPCPEPALPDLLHRRRGEDLVLALTSDTAIRPDNDDRVVLSSGKARR